ncbi:hypothetical protein CN140_01745 [Sinorhizobium meliloti]|uniref:hypothetical protein n=1 Tax=Rhizobium meliloti TaxID=382 RepID=UPI000FD6EF11|nr:hypothetical protein [Sinorhizobium meliloti]RVL87680.1 hypothetical protein CN140_01745 [Sinorhizobium meliloti]
MSDRRGVVPLAWNEPFVAADHAVNGPFKMLKMDFKEIRKGDTYVTIFEITIKNPGVAWLAGLDNPYFVIWEQLPSDPAPVILGRGRIEAMPTSLAQIEVTCEIVCVPPDEDDVLEADADTHRIGEVDYDPDADPEDRAAAEIYDPVFFNPESDDPSDVLKGTLQYYRWDPVTLALTRVGMIESPTSHTVADAQLGSENLQFDNPPRKNSRLRLHAAWTQSASGDCSGQFLAARDIPTFHWKQIAEGMPKTGDAIGSSDGWTIAEAEVNSITDMAEWEFGRLTASPFGASNQKITMLPKVVNISARAHYEYSQDREETIDLYLTSGMQTIMQPDRTEHVDTISLSSLTIDNSTKEWLYEDPDTLEPIEYEVGDRRQANGRCYVCLVAHTASPTFQVWMVDPETDESVEVWQVVPKKAALPEVSARYFDTDRGIRSVRHGLRQLLRMYMERAMCGSLRVTVKAWIGRDIKCGDGITVTSPRLPGGQVIGIVTGVEWDMMASGQNAYVDVAFAPGAGENPTGIEGKLETAGIYYDLTAAAINEPVEAWALAGATPRFVVVENEEPEQRFAGFAAAAIGESPVEAISAMPTAIRVFFDPLRQEDLISRRLSVHTLPIFVPKGVDLQPEIPSP